MLPRTRRLPAVYPIRYFVTGGGLISYGPDTIDQFRRAAGREPAQTMSKAAS
jgi:putative tryptophan/tyrosine transport system substrate-binding protein